MMRVKSCSSPGTPSNEVSASILHCHQLRTERESGLTIDAQIPGRAGKGDGRVVEGLSHFDLTPQSGASAHRQHE